MFVLLFALFIYRLLAVAESGMDLGATLHVHGHLALHRETDWSRINQR